MSGHSRKKGVSPVVSVVIPTYNGLPFVTDTIRSLKQQTFTNFEVLLVDDCSTDATAVEISRTIASDTRFRVFRTPRNLGSAPKSLNFVLPFVRGAFFVYSSQDDLFSTDWLESLVVRAKETKADAVLPRVVFLRDSTERSTTLVGLDGNESVTIPGRLAAQLSLDWSITAFALWRTEVVRRIGFETFSINSDEYSARVFFIHCKLVAFAKSTFYYRQNNPNAVTKRFSTRMCTVPETHLRLALLLREHGFSEDLVAVELRRALSSIIWMRRRLEFTDHRSESYKMASNQLRSTFERLTPLLRGLRGLTGLDGAKVQVFATHFLIIDYVCRLEGRVRTTLRLKSL